MPWKPSEPGEVPTLGYYAIDWIRENLAAPARLEYEPFNPYLEMEDFILWWFELDPVTCRYKRKRGLLGRPRGWGKSPNLAALCALEGLADVVPDGWDADGQPVGKPWHTVKTPLVHIAAVSDEQTANTWQPLLEMLRNGPVMDNYPGLEPLDTFVNLPVGKIDTITSASASTKGAPIVFGVLDQTEEWTPSKNGPLLAQTIRTNAAKNGGRTLESPNAFIPGLLSVAEASAAYALDIAEGRSRRTGLLYDHREAPGETELADEDSLIYGLRVAYGDSSGHPDGCVIHDPPCPPGHMDLEPLIEVIYDPASDIQVIRADFLNQITHASDAWVSSPELTAIKAPDRVIKWKEAITLGFDGSRGRVKGKADATALIGCCVSDGHLFQIGGASIWEPPRAELSTRDRIKTGIESSWTVPLAEVEATLAQAFKDYRVVGFYGDPSGWTEHFAKWESKYGSRLHPKIKASGTSRIEAWPRGKNTNAVELVRRMHTAITNGECTYDGSLALTRHFLNARRRAVRTGYLLYKAHPDSPNKIDGAYAALMAYKARLDAIAAGVGKKPRKQVVARVRGGVLGRSSNHPARSR